MFTDGEIWTGRGRYILHCIYNIIYFTVVTCPSPKLLHGTVEGFRKQNGIFVYKSQIMFSCHPNYHLYGSKYAKCLMNGVWNTKQECVTFRVFKNKCILEGKELEFQGYNKSEAVCVSAGKCNISNRYLSLTV